MKKKQVLKERTSSTEWLAWGWLGLFLIIALFNNGIFQGFGIYQDNQIQFEKPLAISLFAVVLMAIWITIRLFQEQNFWRERRFLYLAGAATLPVIYLISAIGAETPYLASYGWLISLVVFLFFLAGMLLANDQRFLRVLPKVFLIFGYLIVIYGFLNLFGNTYLLDSLSPQNGVRATSIFQYANAYAVMLIILWVTVLIEIGRAKKLTVRIAHSVMLIPICISFLLTLSRGAILILPVIIIVTLIMFRLRQQLLFILYSVLGMGLSLLIYSKIADRGIEVMNSIMKNLSEGKPVDTTSIFAKESLSAWGILLVTSIVMGMLTYVIEKYVVPKIVDNNTSKRKGLLIPLSLLGLIILGGIAVATDLITRFLPPVIRARVETISFNTHSVYERITMYKDAIKIWKLHPIVGGGGGAWQALYEQYQSYSYSSNQPHSYITQLLVEVGMLGLILHIGLIVIIVVGFLLYFRRASEDRRTELVFYFITMVTIMLEALIDFQMSYLLYGALVFLCLGVLAGTQRQELKRLNTRYARATTTTLIGFAGLVVMIFAIRNLYVYNQFKASMDEAGRQGASLQVIEGHLKNANGTNGHHPVILSQLARWNYQAYKQTQDTQYLKLADSYLTKLNKFEPHYRPSVEITYSVQEGLGEAQTATQVLLNRVHEYPYTQNLYDLVAADLDRKWEVAHQSTDSAAEEALGQQIMVYYHEMERRDQIMRDLPTFVEVSRPFSISNTMRLTAGKLQFNQQHYSEAANILKTGITDSMVSQEEQDMVRFYLAALKKTGQDDPALLDKWLKIDPTAQSKLDQLLK